MLLLTKEPDVDGIVCFSDVVAFGVLDAIADLGRRVGSDVRVIGLTTSTMPDSTGPLYQRRSAGS